MLAHTIIYHKKKKKLTTCLFCQNMCALGLIVLLQQNQKQKLPRIVKASCFSQLQIPCEYDTLANSHPSKLQIFPNKKRKTMIPIKPNIKKNTKTECTA